MIVTGREGAGPKCQPMRVLAARVGRTEMGAGWTLDLRQVPHRLVVGATQSGKSRCSLHWWPSSHRSR
ncbi:FtsK/SpoIIIE domain-containing protein [Streptomyces hygroscopicus]|uniref:FtsK/SpoIIIE domain-containing protein n=1 Tax=Streptomyces hygroscopicus TaxID=1912 RepID=UPI0036436B1C